MSGSLCIRAFSHETKKLSLCESFLFTVRAEATGTLRPCPFPFSALRSTEVTEAERGPPIGPPIFKPAFFKHTDFKHAVSQPELVGQSLNTHRRMHRAYIAVKQNIKEFAGRCLGHNIEPLVDRLYWLATYLINEITHF